MRWAGTEAQEAGRREAAGGRLSWILVCLALAAGAVVVILARAPCGGHGAEAAALGVLVGLGVAPLAADAQLMRLGFEVERRTRSGPEPARP